MVMIVFYTHWVEFNSKK